VKARRLICALLRFIRPARDRSRESGLYLGPVLVGKVGKVGKVGQRGVQMMRLSSVGQARKGGSRNNGAYVLATVTNSCIGMSTQICYGSCPQRGVQNA
jgi:hypothetical protein